MILAWHTPPTLATLAQTLEQHPNTTHLIICLPKPHPPTFSLSEQPSLLEQQLYQAWQQQKHCIQFNSANMMAHFLPNLTLWLMPSETSQRLHEHFSDSIQWQGQAIPQTTVQALKPWFTPAPKAPASRAIIIGAGIAGAATARALAEHDLPVTVLEAHQPAQAASGNPQGLLYAKISPHNTEQTELLLQGYGTTRRLLQRLLPEQHTWGGQGVLHLNHSPAETQRNQALAAQNHHAHLYQWASPEQASQHAGITLSQSALYWPQGVWLNPPALIHALLAHPLITCHNHSPLIKAEHNGSEWLAHTPSTTHHGSHIIYCAGAQSPSLPESNAALLPYQLIRGQTSLAQATPFSQQLRCALSATSYISPTFQGQHCFGATFIHHDTATDLRSTDHQINLNELQQLNPALANSFSNTHPAHAALRCDSNDHLPIVGALANIVTMQHTYAKLALDKNYHLQAPCPYLPQAYINTAHGSRGLATAPICAEAIAAEILNTPHPFSQRLRQALHPNRAIIRSIIRHTPL